MPKTTKRWDQRQNIGGVFSDRTNADKAIQDFRDMGVKEQDIEEVVSLNDTVRNGKILMTAPNVTIPAPIIDITLSSRCWAVARTDGLELPASHRLGTRTQGRGDRPLETCAPAICGNSPAGPPMPCAASAVNAPASSVLVAPS